MVEIENLLKVVELNEKQILRVQSLTQSLVLSSTGKEHRMKTSAEPDFNIKNRIMDDLKQKNQRFIRNIKNLDVTESVLMVEKISAYRVHRVCELLIILACFCNSPFVFTKGDEDATDFNKEFKPICTLLVNEVAKLESISTRNLEQKELQDILGDTMNKELGAAIVKICEFSMQPKESEEPREIFSGVFQNEIKTLYTVNAVQKLRLESILASGNIQEASTQLSEQEASRREHIQEDVIRFVTGLKLDMVEIENKLQVWSTISVVETSGDHEDCQVSVAALQRKKEKLKQSIIDKTKVNLNAKKRMDELNNLKRVDPMKFTQVARTLEKSGLEIEKCNNEIEEIDNKIKRLLIQSKTKINGPLQRTIISLYKIFLNQFNTTDMRELRTISRLVSIEFEKKANLESYRRIIANPKIINWVAEQSVIAKERFTRGENLSKYIYFTLLSVFYWSFRKSMKLDHQTLAAQEIWSVLVEFGGFTNTPILSNTGNIIDIIDSVGQIENLEKNYWIDSVVEENLRTCVGNLSKKELKDIASKVAATKGTEKKSKIIVFIVAVILKGGTLMNLSDFSEQSLKARFRRLIRLNQNISGYPSSALVDINMKSSTEYERDTVLQDFEGTVVQLYEDFKKVANDEQNQLIPYSIEFAGKVKHDYIVPFEKESTNVPTLKKMKDIEKLFRSSVVQVFRHYIVTLEKNTSTTISERMNGILEVLVHTIDSRKKLLNLETSEEESMIAFFIIVACVAQWEAYQIERNKSALRESDEKYPNINGFDPIYVSSDIIPSDSIGANTLGYKNKLPPRDPTTGMDTVREILAKERFSKLIRCHTGGERAKSSEVTNDTILKEGPQGDVTPVAKAIYDEIIQIGHQKDKFLAFYSTKRALMFSEKYSERQIGVICLLIARNCKKELFFVK